MSNSQAPNGVFQPLKQKVPSDFSKQKHINNLPAVQDSRIPPKLLKIQKIKLSSGVQPINPNQMKDIANKALASKMRLTEFNENANSSPQLPYERYRKQNYVAETQSPVKLGFKNPEGQSIKDKMCQSVIQGDQINELNIMPVPVTNSEPRSDLKKNSMEKDNGNDIQDKNNTPQRRKLQRPLSMSMTSLDKSSKILTKVNGQRQTKTNNFFQYESPLKGPRKTKAIAQGKQSFASNSKNMKNNLMGDPQNQGNITQKNEDVGSSLMFLNRVNTPQIIVITPQITEGMSSSEVFQKSNDRFLKFTAKSPKPAENQKKRISVDSFQIYDKIGKGAFGDVFLARQKQTRFLCVLKCLSKKKIKQQNLEEQVMRELKIQSYLNHKHLTSIYGFFDDSEKIYLIMEYMPDGSMPKNKKKISEPETAYILKQVCQGLQYMHQQNVIHRDIKPENLLMSDSYVKIADFGCSVFCDSQRNTMVGSFAYISPEQLSNTPYDDKIDVWSVGILAYEILFGKPPFEQELMKIAQIDQQNRQTNDTTVSIQEHIFPSLSFPKEPLISTEAEEFIRNLLNENFVNRMDIRSALKHKFIQKSSEWQLHMLKSTQSSE